MFVKVRFVSKEKMVFFSTRTWRKNPGSMSVCWSSTTGCLGPEDANLKAKSKAVPLGQNKGIVRFLHLSEAPPISAVFRIHNILVWIRIRGSMPLTNGSGSCYFRHWPSRCQQKTNFLKSFFAYYFLKVHLHHFSKIKSPKEVTNSRNQGFTYYFCLLIEESGSIPLTNGSGSGKPKKHVDPDPEHWILVTQKMRFLRLRLIQLLPYADNLLHCSLIITLRFIRPFMQPQIITCGE